MQAWERQAARAQCPIRIRTIFQRYAYNVHTQYTITNMLQCLPVASLWACYFAFASQFQPGGGQYAPSVAGGEGDHVILAELMQRYPALP